MWTFRREKVITPFIWFRAGVLRITGKRGGRIAEKRKGSLAVEGSEIAKGRFLKNSSKKRRGLVKTETVKEKGIDG